MNPRLKNHFIARARVYSSYIGLVLVVLLSISLVRSIARITRASKKVEDAKVKVEEERKRKEKIVAELDIVRSEKYLEEQVRNSLGLVKEGEVVVVLPDEEVLRSLAPKPVEDEYSLPDPIWLRWLKTFGFI